MKILVDPGDFEVNENCCGPADFEVNENCCGSGRFSDKNKLFAMAQYSPLLSRCQKTCYASDR